jgi:hypothetical protein
MQNKAGCWIGETETANSLNSLSRKFASIRGQNSSLPPLHPHSFPNQKNGSLFLSAKPEKTNCQFTFRANSRQFAGKTLLFNLQSKIQNP